MTNLPNIEVQKLSQILTNTSAQNLQKQSILDPAAKVYFVILSMFQTYKKKHQFQLLQQKVHQIKISDNNDQLNVQRDKVTPQSLCQNNYFNAKQILNLIKILNQISQTIKRQLITQIVTKIQTLQNVDQLMKCFQRLLSSDYCLTVQICKNFVQEKMILKLLSMKLKPNDFKIIAKYLPLLPNISSNLLYFIGILFNKVQNLEDYDDLYKIFQLNSNKDQAKMQKREIQTLMKINNKKSLHKIQRLLRTDNQQIIKIAQNQVKQKLLQMDANLGEKNKFVMNFIFLVIKRGSNLWNQIYTWQKTCQQHLKQQFFQKLSQIFEGKNTSQRTTKILKNLQIIKNYEDKSQIHYLFLDYFLNQKKNKQLLRKTLIKNYISSKMTCISKKQSYLDKFFSPQLQFVNIFLNSFNNDQKTSQFFKNVFSTEENTNLLTRFLNDLKQKNPVKFKDFFIKVDRIVTTDLIFMKNLFLLEYIKKNFKIEVASNFIRDLAMYPPSKYLILNIQNLIDSFQNQQGLSNFVSIAARSLNIILIKTPAKQLCEQFKKLLPYLAQKIQNHSQKCYKILFGQVTDQTNKVLRESFIGNRTFKL